MTKCTRDIVFINTSRIPEERICLLKPKATLDELPAQSTDVESDNVIQRYSKRPRQLGKFCLTDYVSKADVIYPKRNRFQEKVKERYDDDSCEVALVMKMKKVFMVITVIVQTCCTKPKTEQNTK